MNTFVPIALFGWPVVAIAFFALLRPRHAVLATLIGGWLFLPVAGYDLPGLPPYNKIIAAVVSALVGIVIFDTKALTSLRPKWIDLPVLIAAFVSPMATSISNGLGFYDGFSNCIDTGVQWFGAWVIGRAYFSTQEGIRELAIGFVAGALVYLPFVLIEVRFSPQLHNWVYGFRVNHFQKVMRLGGFRPNVFMDNGMMVATWMASGTLCALWLWRAKATRAIAGVPMWAIAIGLVAVTLLCRSAYAMLELAVVASALFAVKWSRSVVPFILLAALIPGYMMLRATDTLKSEPLTQLATDLVNEQRAQSLATRLNQEHYYTDHAKDRLLLGWGGYDRFKPKHADAGRAADGVDALWTIVLSRNGLVGIVSLYAMFLLPMLIVVFKLKGGRWNEPQMAFAIAVSGTLLIFLLDTLLNALYNPLFVAVAGGLACYRPGAAVVSKAIESARRSRPLSGNGRQGQQRSVRVAAPLRRRMG